MRSVPSRSTTQAAPTIKMVMMTSMPAANPRGTAITARNGPYRRCLDPVVCPGDRNPTVESMDRHAARIRRRAG